MEHWGLEVHTLVPSFFGGCYAISDRAMFAVQDSSKRPTDFASKYRLGEDGRVSYTDYWFCSDECFEEAMSKYLDKEYSPEYGVRPDKPVAPTLVKELRAIEKKHLDRTNDPDFNDNDPTSERVADRIIKEMQEEERIEIINWQCAQAKAINQAKYKLQLRIEEESQLRAAKLVRKKTKGME